MVSYLRSFSIMSKYYLNESMKNSLSIFHPACYYKLSSDVDGIRYIVHSLTLNPDAIAERFNVKMKIANPLNNLPLTFITFYKHSYLYLHLFTSNKEYDVIHVSSLRPLLRKEPNLHDLHEDG